MCYQSWIHEKTWNPLKHACVVANCEDDDDNDGDDAVEDDAVCDDVSDNNINTCVYVYLYTRISSIFLVCCYLVGLCITLTS